MISNNIINKRIAMLRDEMKKHSIDIYIVPTSDFHESEYVGDYFKAREYITGFTGSSGIALITMTEANLWTDGRYFIQAENELSNTEIILKKSGVEGVPSITEYIKSVIKPDDNIGFDGRLINYRLGKSFEAQLINGKIIYNMDLINNIWQDRPELSAKPVTLLEECYSGKSTKQKLSEVRQEMKKKNADIHLISSLCDICYILNIRGADIDYVPVVLAFLLITEKDCILFVQEKSLTAPVLNYFEKNHVNIRSYFDIYDYISKIEPVYNSLLIDTSEINYSLYRNINSGINIIDSHNPSAVMKAIKNKTELNNIRNAHIKDGIAMCKFMYWLKNNIGKLPMTELSVSDYLYELRSCLEGFISLSFETISGYNEHGAIVHYSATKESNKVLNPEGFLLVDSGAHYYEGTTDVTRTFALGSLTKEMKQNFTRVCRSNINLANTRFLYGCSGINLDIIAREPLWSANLDYRHGTGHGVGYILNVHEGPNAFRYKITDNPLATLPLEEGMITTDEPGLYIENQYGIRTESELICIKALNNEYGQFMEFENITYVPIDLDAILPEEMSNIERKHLNEYHKKVFDTISPFLTSCEKEWLRQYTRPV